MLAPPDLRDGVQSLEYWQARQRRLPPYRIVARREAARKVVVWEHRVRAAALRQRGVPLAERLEGVRLVASTQLGRWGRRAARLFGVMVTAMVVTPVLLALYVLLHVT